MIVAEDQGLLRMSTHEALTGGGYGVASVATGESALLLLREQPDVYSGLITDVNLGGEISGWALAREARELNPGICVVYLTSESVAEWPAEGVPESQVLQKPFADAQLLTAISTLLNKRARLS